MYCVCVYVEHVCDLFKCQVLFWRIICVTKSQAACALRATEDAIECKSNFKKQMYMSSLHAMDQMFLVILGEMKVQTNPLKSLCNEKDSCS